METEWVRVKHEAETGWNRSIFHNYGILRGANKQMDNMVAKDKSLFFC